MLFLQGTRDTLADLGLISDELIDQILSDEIGTRLFRHEDYLHLMLTGCRTEDGNELQFERADVVMAKQFLLTAHEGPASRRRGATRGCWWRRLEVGVGVEEVREEEEPLALRVRLEQLVQRRVGDPLGVGEAVRDLLVAIEAAREAEVALQPLRRVEAHGPEAFVAQPSGEHTVCGSDRFAGSDRHRHPEGLVGKGAGQAQTYRYPQYGCERIQPSHER